MFSLNRTTTSSSCSLVAGFLLLANIAHAQTIGGEWNLIGQIDGVDSSDQLGSSVSLAGDVDGDGFDDLIVGAIWASPGGLTYAGSAYVYSGATGFLLWQFDGRTPYELLGASVSGAGDVDGDGFDDLIVGAPEADAGGLSSAGSAYVYSGATGGLLWRLDGQASFDNLGSSVSGAGDVNGDGFGDIIVGATWAHPGGVNNSGSAYVYSGATGFLLWQFDGRAPSDYLGNVAGAGDVDGDGFDDLIVGADGADPGGLARAGSAYVYSGATGFLLWQFDGRAPSDFLGSSVSGAGDVDGDGFDDLIVGAYGAAPGGLSRAGSAYVYSGATGGFLWQFDGQSRDDQLGYRVAGAGDVDWDGFDDLIVGANGADAGGLSSAGSAYVYSGATGGLLWRLDGQASYDNLGSSVSGAGDVNGDGFGDIIVGADSADPGGLQNAGSAYVFSPNPFLHLSKETISFSGAHPTQLNLAFTPSEVDMPYTVLFSLEGIGPSRFQGLWIPLTQDSHFQFLLGNPQLRGTLDANAEAQVDLTMHQRTPSGAIGHTVHVAAVTLDPGTWAGRMSSIVRYLEVVP